MDGVWVPQDQITGSLCALLAAFQHLGANQSQILAQLSQYRALPDFDSYLALILAKGEGQPVEVRQSAGLLLKNDIKRDQWARLAPISQATIKVALLQCIGHPEQALRRTVGSSVAAVVAAAGLAAWPELVPALAAGLGAGDVATLEGSLDCLHKVCEDAPAELEVKLGGSLQRASDILIPKLLGLFTSPHDGIRAMAVSNVNLLAGAIVAGMPSALTGALAQYMEGLFRLATDPSLGVRRAVCAGLVHMLQLQPGLLAPQMRDVIQYMLESTQHADEEVALEACEFWGAYCEAELDNAQLRPFLPQLVPVLLRNMVYNEFDEEVADAEAAEHPGLSQNSDAEVRPFIHRGADSRIDEESGHEVARWNLRKCSAAALDVLSTVFEEDLLPIVSPVVEQRLQDPDWRARESAVLALGAISEGCHRGLVPFMGPMVTMLTPKLSDERPLVRSITCWTLSRYSRWLVADGKQPHSDGQMQLDLVITGLLARVLDHNQHVQEAACSALATLEEAAGPELIPRLKAILETLARAVLVYGRRNARILYDALGTLAEAVHGALAEPMFLGVIMPPLVQKWHAVADTDRELLPLLECFMTLAHQLGPAFGDFAEPVFERCLRIASSHVGEKSQQDPTEDRDFLICALDTLSGVLEALGPKAELLLGRSGLREIILHCCQDVSPDIRQSAFALVGDLARVACPYLSPALTQVVALALANLEPAALSKANMAACNNACWSLGEIALQQSGEVMAPYATPILEHLVPVLQSPRGAVPSSLVDNSAITLGRVAWTCPEAVSLHLEHFIGPWCAALRHLQDGIEKEHAFLGLCDVVRLNPQGAAVAFTSLCEAVVSWQIIRHDGLLTKLSRIMQMYKAKLVELGQWNSYLSALSPAAREKLVNSFQL